MGLLDKAKTFFGASAMVALEFTVLAGQRPGEAVVRLGDTALRGRYRVTAKEDCVVVRHVAQVLSRWPERDGMLGTVAAESVFDVEDRPLKAGETREVDFAVEGVDFARQLASYGLDGLDARVEFLVRVVVDVRGSPFDPEFEQGFLVAP